MCDVCDAHKDHEDDLEYAVRRLLEYLADGTPRTFRELRNFDHSIETDVLANALDYLMSEEKVTTDSIHVAIKNV